MNLLDALLAVIVGISVALAFVAGFARAGIGFLATVCGMVFGFWFYGIPAEWLHKYLSSVTLSNVFGFLIVFMGVQFAGALVAKLLAKLLKWTGLSWLDRLMGAGFGLVRGALIAVAFVAVLMAFTPKPTPNWMVDSVLLPYAVDASDLCAALAPNALKQAFRDSLAEIRKDWDDQLKKNHKLKKVDN